MRKVERTCEQCGALFQARAVALAQGLGRYCSRACFHVARRINRITRSCQQCGAEFQVLPFRVDDPDRGKFCGKRCYWASKKTERIPLAVRFWGNVSKGDGCWAWTGQLDRKGYGVIGVGGREGGMVHAHRIAWQLECGEIPAGQFVLHHCDNPRCVRPDHLFLGTAADNSADMVNKGRQCKGESQPASRLTVCQVIEIRRRHRNGELQKTLAECFGVARPTISDIISGRTWSHVTDC